MKAILKLIDDLRNVMEEQFRRMESETDNYTWGIMNDTTPLGAGHGCVGNGCKRTVTGGRYYAGRSAFV